MLSLYFFADYAAGDNTYALLAFPSFSTLGYALRVNSGGSIATRSLAGYADYTWQFAPRWSLELGGRYTHDTKHAIIRNCTNKHYRTSGFNIIALGMVTGYYSPPRMITARARYQF